VTVHATILNLVPPDETDEKSLLEKLGADTCTLIPGKDVRERGARKGLQYLKSIHRDTGASIFAIHSRDWSRQTRRTSLYGLAVLVPAKKRAVVDLTGKIIPLTWTGFWFGEFPRSLVQKWEGRRLLGRTRSMLRRVLRQKPVHRVAPPGTIEKILYMRTDLWFGVRAGGSIGHVAGVINGFEKQGIKIEILSWDRPPLVTPKAKLIKVLPSKFFVNDRELALLAYNGKLTSTMARSGKQAGPDAVYARYSLYCWAPVTIAEMFEIPLILEYNGSEVWIERHWGQGLKYTRIAEQAEEWVLMNAEAITVVSEPLKDELVKRGIESQRILVNPNAVDPERFNPDLYSADEINELKKKLGIPEGITVAGFIGTFSPWHGVDVLACAIPLALNNNPKLRFLLIGSGPLLEKVRDQLRTADVLDKVTFTGLVPQEDAPKYLMCCDFFLSPHVPNPDGTKFFGSPTKMFEYMALGKGIIASDLDQLGRVLTDGETALLVPPGDAEKLAKAIVRLTEDPELSDRLGKNARELVLREYTWRAHVEKILDHLYNQ
jgi:glycosyltransferase involved in cell wall biosynthesis